MVSFQNVGFRAESSVSPDSVFPGKRGELPTTGPEHTAPVLEEEVLTSAAAESLLKISLVKQDAAFKHDSC